MIEELVCSIYYTPETQKSQKAFAKIRNLDYNNCWEWL